MVIFILVAGLEFPIGAGVIGYVLILSRIFFAFYISKNGPVHPLRGLGALLGDFGMLASLILAIIACARHMT